MSEDYGIEDDKALKCGVRQVHRNLNGVDEYHRERYSWAIKYINKSDTVLDAGCGIGYGCKLLAPACQKVYAFDYSQDSINFAKQWYGNYASYDVADVQALYSHVWPDSKKVEFDVATCFEVIEHVESDDLAIKSLYEVIKPGGKLIISIPQDGHPAKKHKYHRRDYSIEEIVQLLAKYKFRADTIKRQFIDHTFGCECRRNIKSKAIVIKAIK